MCHTIWIGVGISPTRIFQFCTVQIDAIVPIQAVIMD